MWDQIYKIGSVPPFCSHSHVGQGIYRLEIPSPFCLHTNVGQEYVLKVLFLILSTPMWDKVCKTYLFYFILFRLFTIIYYYFIIIFEGRYTDAVNGVSRPLDGGW